MLIEMQMCIFALIHELLFITNKKSLKVYLFQVKTHISAAHNGDFTKVYPCTVTIAYLLHCMHIGLSLILYSPWPIPAMYAPWPLNCTMHQGLCTYRPMRIFT